MVRGEETVMIPDFGPPKYDLSSNIWSLVVASRIAIEELGSYLLAHHPTYLLTRPLSHESITTEECSIVLRTSSG